MERKQKTEYQVRRQPSGGESRSKVKWFWHKSGIFTCLMVFLLIGLVFLAMIASALIVYTANNDSIASWSVPAAVPLAIMSSLVNICLATVLSFGVAVSWWRSASRGTTLKSLHLIWERGMGATFWPAMISGYDTRRVAMVAILVAAIKFANNPLLQNALRTERNDVVEKVQMNIGMADRIPDGYLGTRKGMVEQYERSTTLGDIGARALRGWYLNQTVVSIPARVRNLEEWEKICPRNTADTCDGFACPVNSTCKTMVRSAGIKYECETSNRTIDLRNHIGKGVFNISITRAGHPNDPGLLLNTEFLTNVNESCWGVLESESCLIQAATVDIPITFEWSLVKAHGEQRIVSVYRSDGDLADAPKGTKAGPLSGIEYAIGNFFQSLSTLEAIDTVSSDTIATTFWSPKSHLEDCGNEYLRPTGHVIFAMQEFMAYASIFAARVSDGAFDRSVTAEKFTPTTVYKADFRYLGAALAVMFVGLLAVGMLLWDWWSLDRLNVTLSPVETAKAFAAPILLSQRQKSGDVEVILKQKGHLKVKYDGDVMVATDGGDGADAELSLLKAQNP